MATWIPASAAYPSCVDLAVAARNYQSGLTDQNPLQPENVDARHTIGIGFFVSWDISSNRPGSTVGTPCAHITHAGSGDNVESCATGHNNIRTFSYCVTGTNCYGTFNIKVKLTNGCNLTDEYSGPVSLTYTGGRTPLVPR